MQTAGTGEKLTTHGNKPLHFPLILMSLIVGRFKKL